MLPASQRPTVLHWVSCKVAESAFATPTPPVIKKLVIAPNIIRNFLVRLMVSAYLGVWCQ